MTGRPHSTEAPTSEIRVDDPGPDAADAADYAAGRITLDEYDRRIRARHGTPAPGSGETLDPVAAFDAMWEAATSLMGSYVWLADHASTPQEAERWWTAYSHVIDERSGVDPRDVHAQRTALARFIVSEQALRSLVRP